MAIKMGYKDAPVITSDRKISEKHAEHSFKLNHGHSMDHGKGEVRSFKRLSMTNPKKAKALASKSASDYAKVSIKMSKFAGISSNLTSAQKAA